MRFTHLRPVARPANSGLDTFVELFSYIGLTIYSGAALLKQNLFGS